MDIRASDTGNATTANAAPVITHGGNESGCLPRAICSGSGGDHQRQVACEPRSDARSARGVDLVVELWRVTERPVRPSLIERRAQRIANARSVTVGLALTFVALALVGSVVIRIADEHDFPSFGLAVWWALQTVTTVGYGDVVPTTNAGRVIGGIELVLGVSFVAFLTAGVTSTVVQRGQARAVEAERAREARDLQTTVDALAEIRDAIGNLDRRLDNIESTLGD